MNDICEYAELGEPVCPAAAARNALAARLKEHEQFRHQHRDCDAMGVENQSLRARLAEVDRLREWQRRAVVQLNLLRDIGDEFDLESDSVNALIEEAGRE